MSFYHIEWDSERIVINGLIVEDKNHSLEGPRRKALRRLWTTDVHVTKEIERLKQVELAVGIIQRTAVKETISFLHDVRTSVGVVLSNAERLIGERSGVDFAQKMSLLRRENPTLFNLHGSINLLTEQLNFADLISNPDSITDGNRPRSAIRPFFYRMCKIFEVRANDRHLFIDVSGDTSAYVYTYQSFQLVPVILLDNAVKYGTPRTNILVRFEEKPTHLEVRVTSFGEVVPETEREAIFKRYVRGSNTARMPKGSGLGLYLAKRIVEAHEYSISYEADEANDANTFILAVPRQHIS